MKKFLAIVLLLILLTVCSCNHKTADILYGYSIEPNIIKELYHDTITSTDLSLAISDGSLPDLSKMKTSPLKNYEENRAYMFYNYIDTQCKRIYNIKQVIETNDTLYIIQIRSYN